VVLERSLAVAEYPGRWVGASRGSSGWHHSPRPGLRSPSATPSPSSSPPTARSSSTSSCGGHRRRTPWRRSVASATPVRIW